MLADEIRKRSIERGKIHARIKHAKIAKKGAWTSMVQDVAIAARYGIVTRMKIARHRADVLHKNIGRAVAVYELF